MCTGLCPPAAAVEDKAKFIQKTKLDVDEKILLNLVLFLLQLQGLVIRKYERILKSEHVNAGKDPGRPHGNISRVQNDRQKEKEQTAKAKNNYLRSA